MSTNVFYCIFHYFSFYCTFITLCYIKHYHIIPTLYAFLPYLYYDLLIFMYISLCLHIVIAIIPCVLALYLFIKHYTIVILYANHTTYSYTMLCRDHQVQISASSSAAAAAAASLSSSASLCLIKHYTIANVTSLIIISSSMLEHFKYMCILGRL